MTNQGKGFLTMTRLKFLAAATEVSAVAETASGGGGTLRSARLFKDKLRELRIDKGLSQSDLAKALWGTTTDGRGYDVARNRSRISSYEKGDSVPDKHNLRKLSQVLGVTDDELAPDLAQRVLDQAEAAIQMKMIAGRPDQVRLTLDTLCSLATATKIISLLTADPSAVAYASGE
jgi:transcriptional regulator with XRE-family HTH domain